MRSADIDQLVISIAAIRRLFSQYVYGWADDRLAELQSQLARGDVQTVSRIISEVTGSAGSLGDRFICAENGDDIRSDETNAVNCRFAELVRALEDDARSIATKLGIALLR